MKKKKHNIGNENPISKIEVGDRVKHRYMDYGEGKVIEIKSQSYWPIVIRFDRYSNIESFSEPFLVLVKKHTSK